MEYLVTVRGRQVSQMGYVSAGFGGGGVFTRKVCLAGADASFWREERMVLVYCGLCLGSQFILWP